MIHQAIADLLGYALRAGLIAQQLRQQRLLVRHAEDVLADGDGDVILPARHSARKERLALAQDAQAVAVRRAHAGNRRPVEHGREHGQIARVERAAHLKRGVQLHRRAGSDGLAHGEQAG